MKYYKIQYPKYSIYACTERDDGPFWWYDSKARIKKWVFTGVILSWGDWLQNHMGPVSEVSKLEVLVVVGSVKE